MKNYYAILEVPVGSDISVIRESYRRLVQENLWNKEVFVELKEAYEVLSTPVRRMEYDKANFGQTFAVAGSEADTRLQAGDDAGGEAARHCPMNAGAQCPVLSARLPLEETFCPECGFLLAAMPPEGFVPLAGSLDITRVARLEGQEGRAHRLHAGVNSVGREAADVLLTDKTVSRQHAQVEIADDGRVYVEDLGSTNGTRVNEAPVSARVRKPVGEGDTLRFGSVTLVLRLPELEPEEASRPPDLGEKIAAAPSAAPPESEAAGTPDPVAPPASLSILDIVRDARARLIGSRNGAPVREDPLVPGVTTFGRRSENNVVLRDDPYISGTHAQIIAEDDVFRLTDLGSTNGTFLNGQRLNPNEPVVLQAGDEITLGGLTYRFEPRAAAEAEEEEAEAEESPA
ncbi:MAG: FHA domain-containing protein [Armatimonadetes bacterium]|nr:FHA domain-containing protein [Armatimonadota bacterium]